MAEDIILQVSHLGKSFGSHEVLKDIHFDVKKGEVISVIGSSGSGKSTTVNPEDGGHRPRGIVIKNQIHPLRNAVWPCVFYCGKLRNT